MLIRKILACVFLSVLSIGFFCPKAANAAQTPQEFVKEFYEWYFIKDYDFSDALKQDKIMKYVDEALIADLKEEQKFHELNYFTQMGSQFSGFENADVRVDGVLPMANNMFVVPVIVKKDSLEKILVVYVRKKDGSFKISSISDSYPY